MNDAAPVVVLDVDGVLNRLVPPVGSLGPSMSNGVDLIDSWVAIEAKDWPAGSTDEPKDAPFLRPLNDGTAQGVHLWLNKPDGAWVNELLGRGVEVAWMTTWRQAANTVLAPLLHISPLPVIDGAVADGETSPEWKARLVREYAGDRPLVWCDDQIPAHIMGAPGDWRAAPTLLIRPHAEVGITPAHRAQIDAWLAGQIGADTEATG